MRLGAVGQREGTEDPVFGRRFGRGTEPSGAIGKGFVEQIGNAPLDAGQHVIRHFNVLTSD